MTSRGRQERRSREQRNSLATISMITSFARLLRIFFYVRAICGASYRKQNHKLSLALDKSSGAVLYSYCTCRAGKGGFCNHMYGLMKIVASFSLEKRKCVPNMLPCTSKPCGWTVPKKRELGVSKPSITETVVKKNKPNSMGVKCKLYEARALPVRELDLQKVIDCQEKLSAQNLNIPFATFAITEICSQGNCDTQFGKASIYSPLSYQCPKFGENFNVYTSLNNDPVSQNVLPVNGNVPLFPHCGIPCYYSPNISDFSDCELIIWDDLQL